MIKEKETNNIDDITKIYFKEIDRYSILSKEEEKGLLRKYKEQHDMDSYQKLINHNLRLSLFVAKKYEKICSSMTLLDLIQENNIILMKSIENFDSKKGSSLASYAIEAMHRNLRIAIDKEDKMIRIPVYLEEKKFKYQKYIKLFYMSNQRYPTDQEIISELSFKKEELEFLKKIHRYNYASLNALVDEENSHTDTDTATIESLVKYQETNYLKYDNLIDKQILKKTLKKLLSPKDYYIIYNRMIRDDNKSLDYLGKILDVSFQAINSKEKTILKKIKKSLTGEQQKKVKKYKISELMKSNVDPIFPEHQAIYYCMKNYLDDLTYYILYTRKFNKEDNNISYYQQKFPLASLEAITDGIKLCVELETKFNQDKFIFKALEIVKKKYTIDQIFELNIKPIINMQYQLSVNYFNDYSFEDIRNTQYFNKLNSSEQSLIKKYFKVSIYKDCDKETFKELEKDINQAILANYNLTEEEVKDYFNKVQNNLSEHDKKEFESYFCKKNISKEKKQKSLIDISYKLLNSQNRCLFNLSKMNSSDMKVLLLSKKISLKKHTIENIKKYYNISERDLMSGKEKRKVMKMLSPLYKEKGKQKLYRK